MDTSHLVNITRYAAVFLIMSKPVIYIYTNNSILNDGVSFDLNEKVNNPKQN